MMDRYGSNIYKGGDIMNALFLMWAISCGCCLLVSLDAIRYSFEYFMDKH